MLYLASQFAWFLLAAFVLGLVMGRLAHDGVKGGLWNRKLGYLLALVAIAAGLTWTHTLNGVAALWVESALLFLAAYLAGCVLAALLSGTRQAEVTAPLVQAAPAPVPVMPPTDAANRPVSTPLAKVEGEDSIPGRRPGALAVAHDDTPDDLKIIKGIGPQNEGRLHALGIWHFQQIADWTPDNVEWVGSYLAFPGRIEREDWIGQAKELAASPSGTQLA